MRCQILGTLRYEISNSLCTPPATYLQQWDETSPSQTTSASTLIASYADSNDTLPAAQLAEVS